jgi:hypothetical protein
MDDVELAAFLCDLQSVKCVDCQFHKNISLACSVMDFLHEEMEGAYDHEKERI